MIEPLPSLRKTMVEGGAVLLASQLAKLCLQLVAVSVISHLLQPRDYGLIALAAPFLAFATLLGDFGFSQVVVQKGEISQEQLSALFWITLVMGCLLAAALAMSAPFTGRFYREPLLVLPMIALSSLLIFKAMSAPQMALLTRYMRFRAIAAVEISSVVIGSAIGILVAWSTRSFWALVASQAVVSICTVAGTWIASRWRPSFLWRAPEIGLLLRFGRNVAGFNLVNFFARNLDNVLIGKVWGDAMLGSYDQAYKMLLFPLNQITAPLGRLALPLLSRLLPEPERYRRSYFSLLEKILVLTVPLTAYLLVMADRIIPAFLGPQWHAVIPIFQWLGLGAFFAPIANSTGWLFMSQNRTGEMFVVGMVSSTLFILSFFIGIGAGGLGVARAYILMGYFVQAPIMIWAVTRSGPVNLKHIVGMIATFAIGTVGTLAILYVAKLALLSNSIVATALGLPLAYPIFLAVLTLFPEGRLVMREIWAILRRAVKGHDVNLLP